MDRKKRNNIAKYHVGEQVGSLEFTDTATTKRGHFQNAVEHIKKEHNVTDCSQIKVNEIQTRIDNL